MLFSSTSAPIALPLAFDYPLLVITFFQFFEDARLPSKLWASTHTAPLPEASSLRFASLVSVEIFPWFLDGATSLRKVLS